MWEAPEPWNRLPLGVPPGGIYRWRDLPLRAHPRRMGAPADPVQGEETRSQNACASSTRRPSP